MYVRFNLSGNYNSEDLQSLITRSRGPQLLSQDPHLFALQVWLSNRAGCHEGGRHAGDLAVLHIQVGDSRIRFSPPALDRAALNNLIRGSRTFTELADDPQQFGDEGAGPHGTGRPTPPQRS